MAPERVSITASIHGVRKNRHYLNATRCKLYGIEKSPSQVGPLGFTARTEFEGLFLCGQSTTSHGVAGVTASGVEVAKAILNCRTRDLLKQSGASLTFLPSDGDSRVSEWPEGLRRKMGEVAREEERDV